VAKFHLLKETGALLTSTAKLVSGAWAWLIARSHFVRRMRSRSEKPWVHGHLSPVCWTFRGLCTLARPPFPPEGDRPLVCLRLETQQRVDRFLRPPWCVFSRLAARCRTNDVLLGPSLGGGGGKNMSNERHRRAVHLGLGEGGLNLQLSPTETLVLVGSGPGPTSRSPHCR